ncbi:MAG: heat shock protein transcriptional repressor HspR [Anaerolineae bacterium]
MPTRNRHDEPCYIISVAARLVNVHPQTLRYYERLGLIRPARSRGNVRLYSERDIQRVRRICRLTEELGVNLAGVEVILNMTERMERMREEMERMESQFEAEMTRMESEFVAEIERLRRRLRAVQVGSDTTDGDKKLRTQPKRIKVKVKKGKEGE